MTPGYASRPATGSVNGFGHRRHACKYVSDGQEALTHVARVAWLVGQPAQEVGGEVAAVLALQVWALPVPAADRAPARRCSAPAFHRAVVVVEERVVGGIADRHPILATPKTSSSVRDVRMQDFVQEAIAEHAERLKLGENDVLCRTAKGTPFRRGTWSRRPAPGPATPSMVPSRRHAPGPRRRPAPGHVHPMCTGSWIAGRNRRSSGPKGVSRPVGRVLCPRVVRGDGHPSRTAVAGSLVRSTRKHRAGSPRTLAQAVAVAGVRPLDLAPGGVYLAVAVACGAGGLLHHPFTLTLQPKLKGGLLSVALSRGSPRVGVTDHPAVWSPDLPHRTARPGATARPTHPERKDTGRARSRPHSASAGAGSSAPARPCR
jgi:hypothetical protein